MENEQHITYMGMEISKDPRWSKYEEYHTNKEQTTRKENNYNKSTEATWQIYF